MKENIRIIEMITNIRYIQILRVLLCFTFPLATAAMVGCNASPRARTRRTRIQAAEVVVPKEIIEPELARLVASLKKTLAKTHARSKTLRAMPEWQWVEKLETAVKEIEKDRAAGDITGAYKAAVSWKRVGQIRRKVENLVIAAIPFAVIGPFGEKDFTAPESPWKWPGRKGLDVPWLGEFKEPPTAAHARLPETFDPGLNVTHKGFSGREVRWCEQWKTEALTFEDTSAEAPYWAVSYVYGEVYSPEHRAAAIWMNGNVAGLLGWLNGRLWFYLPPKKSGAEWNPPRLPGGGRGAQGGFSFNKGRNRLLLKVLHRHNTRLDLGVLHGRTRTPMLDVQFRTPLTSVEKDK